MKLFDAHCHPPKGDLDSILARAAAAGVEGMAVCIELSKPWNQLRWGADVFPEIGKRRRDVPVVFPMVGIHPWFVEGRDGSPSRPRRAGDSTPYRWKERFRTLEKTVRAYAIGETGLDFCGRFENRAEQEECFAAHLDLARELSRPVTVHCVQAWGRLIEIIKAHPAPNILLHAFGGSAELIPELIELNCWFSFGEAVMNPNAKKARASVVAVPVERLLIETDSAGEPEKLIAVARAVAELRGVSVEEIAELTFNNAQKIFFDGMNRMIP